MFLFGLEHNASALGAIDGHLHRVFKTHNAQVGRLIFRLKLLQILGVKHFALDLGVDCEISRSERGQILEEV